MAELPIPDCPDWRVLAATERLLNVTFNTAGDWFLTFTLPASTDDLPITWEVQTTLDADLIAYLQRQGLVPRRGRPAR